LWTTATITWELSLRLRDEAVVCVESKISLYAACCIALLWTSRVEAVDDSGYYEALAQAEAAEQSGDPSSALQAFEAMQRTYPRDYTVNLRLGWAHYRLRHFAEAERAYRAASEISHGSTAALLGLGWALIEQNRCAEARPILSRMVSETSQRDAAGEHARAGLGLCQERHAVRGTLWAGAGATLYHRHPWKRSSSEFAAGLGIAPYPWLRTAAAYRFLRLDATDNRVAGYDQHEAYAQAGYAAEKFEWLANGAVVWSGNDVQDGSRHLGLSGRIRTTGTLLLELSGSWYRDLWVARLAPAWEFYLGNVSLTPGVALQRFAQRTLATGSLTASLVLGRASIWLGGKVGSEYRAAYLSSFSVANAEERSQWGLWAGMRIRVGDWITFLLSYAFSRLKSADGLLSDLHGLNVGTVYAL
jgi:opacity protein-like surface antigen